MSRESRHKRTYLKLGVSSITNVHKVTKLWRINLLILWGNHQRGNTNKLQVTSQHLCLGQVSIHNLHSDVKCIRVLLELVVNVTQPIDEDGTHTIIDRWLGIKKRPKYCSMFLGAEVFVHVLNVIGDEEWIRMTFVNIISRSILVVLRYEWYWGANLERSTCEFCRLTKLALECLWDRCTSWLKTRDVNIVNATSFFLVDGELGWSMRWRVDGCNVPLVRLGFTVVELGWFQFLRFDSLGVFGALFVEPTVRNVL